MNGGTCIDLVNGFNCSCTSPLFGKHCELGMGKLLFPTFLLHFRMPVLWYAFVDCRHRIFKGGLGGGGEVGGAKAPPPAAPSPSLKIKQEPLMLL